jgi:nitric oxide dioxygenase
MLSPHTIEIVKATAPVVAANAEAITQRFYHLMFTGDPSVKAFFNQSHQQTGGQPRALAAAICAYAANIDNLEALGTAVELIAQKHCALMIKPEHYPIVGKHLLVAIKDVLDDVVTEEIIAAWAEAYGFLANVFITREAEIYREQAEVPGGWTGYRPFIVARKQRESEIITSFYLKPQDGGPLPMFKPGQYVTVQVDHPRTPTSPRNYSLSDRPGLDYYRISVKREPGSPPGLISSYLHDEVQQGDVLAIGPPCGEFTLDVERVGERPIVLVSGGVGLTPMTSMLNTLAHHNVGVPVLFVHGARNSATHAFHDEVRQIEAESSNVRVHVVYSDPFGEEGSTSRCDGIGLIDVPLLESLLPGLDGQFYLCGPKIFMASLYHGLVEAGVPDAQIHFEFFGPKQELTRPFASEHRVLETSALAASA